MKYSTILFDLDGTVTDPRVGITKSVRYALSYFGIVENDEDKLVVFIGSPLKPCFRQYYGLSERDAQKAVELYREYYGKGGLFENRVYEGMGDLLKELKSLDKRIFLATSKMTDYAVNILDHFGLTAFFDHVVGSNPDGSRSEKTETLRYIMETHGVRPEGSVMVGDRKYDAIAARSVGMDSIGVGYGYGSREELNAVGFTLYAEDLPSLRKELLR